MIKLLMMILLMAQMSFAQDTQVNYKGYLIGPSENSPSKGHGRQNDEDVEVFIETLAPFYHGVASGDPQTDRVIIWTKVTTQDMSDIDVNWKVSTSVDMANVIREGSYTTGSDQDFIIKLDVDGLSAGTTYYYQFEYDGKPSLIGRTKTLPDSDVESLRIAVISCVNYQWGYFNALERIAERADLDAVLHMGDYFYEYGDSYYYHPILEGQRAHDPDYEVVSVTDYRTRFSQYRLDPQMIRFHQQHPVIAVWDDHESTNDSYRDGAENHQEDNEGDWSERVDNSTQVYNEWMPIRMPNPQDRRKINRSFKFGNLLDLYMLELRLSGKDEPMGSKAAGLPFTELPQEEIIEVFNSERKMIDDEQFSWLVGGITTTDAQWKIVGSSVMMVPFPAFFNPDAWDGYYVQRETLFGALQQAGVTNFGAVSGDFHMSFATNLITNSLTDPSNSVPVGFEFTTPSITSANINEQESLPVVDPVSGETIIINPLEMNLPERSAIAQALEQDVVQSLPWFHYANSDQHGYMIVDVNENRVQCDWYHVESVLQPYNDNEMASASAVVQNQNPLVQMVDEPVASKTDAPELAPFPSILSVENESVLNMGAYPNPAQDYTVLHFALNKNQNIGIKLFDLSGNELSSIETRKYLKGVHSAQIDLNGLNSGTYIIKMESPEGITTCKVVVTN